MPGFSSRLALIKHGAGDREGGYKARHAAFDLTLVGGEKDRRRMIDRGLCTPENCAVGGYAKFELRAPRQRFFANDRPVLLYNPHFDAKLSSWVRHGQEVLAALEALEGWNVIIAPHTKLGARAAPIRTTAPHIRVDMGSRHSIDMSYTMSADVYLGDVSSQVYEFLLEPRPCIFLNLEQCDWRGDETFAHWRLGQVVEDIAALPEALHRAAGLQAAFVDAQEAAMSDSIDRSPFPPPNGRPPSFWISPASPEGRTPDDADDHDRSGASAAAGRQCDPHMGHVQCRALPPHGRKRREERQRIGRRA